MPEINDSVTINRAPEEIWAFLIDNANLPLYESQVVETEQVNDGPVAVGTQWKGVNKVLGIKFPWTVECIALEEPRTYTTKTIESKLPFEVSWTLTPEGSATRIDYHLEAESGLGGLFGKLGEPMVVKAQERTVRNNLATLKELLEAQ